MAATTVWRRQRIVILLFALMCGSGTIGSLVRVSDWGSALSDVDRFSEANAFREVSNFRDEGLTRYYGLGNVYHPGIYLREGFEPSTVDQASVTPEGVSTHYPPGPEYLLYAAESPCLAPSRSRDFACCRSRVGWAATLYLGFCGSPAIWRRGGMVGDGGLVSWRWRPRTRSLGCTIRVMRWR